MRGKKVEGKAGETSKAEITDEGQKGSNKADDKSNEGRHLKTALSSNLNPTTTTPPPKKLHSTLLLGKEDRQ
jgi:hypothetical protein